MEDIKVVTVILLLWALLSEVASQNLIKNSKDQKTEHQLLINEVNADNPGLDTSEFVELYHTSGQNVTLDGYYLVFYNGKFNTAYKVLNLNGHMTNERGFFLIGSTTVTPYPSIILPSNTIQNGPDAIALYFGRGIYRENMRVTSDGLVDALIHKSKETDKADGLLSVLTPGKEAFLEDPLFRTTDESIERCLGTDSQWTFQVATPSPGRENHCGSEFYFNVSTVVISEVSTVASPEAFEFVELQGSPSTSLQNLVLVLIDGQTKQVYFSMDVYGKTSPAGLFLIGPAQSKIPVNQPFPENSSRPLLQLGPDAVALYRGNSSSFQPGTALSVTGLVDALVYTRGESTDPELLKVLTPDRYIFYENERFQPGDESVSRCSCCSIVRDPSVYVLSHPTPGQQNQCPSRNFSQAIAFCLRVVDCSEWSASQAIYEIQIFLARSLAAECNFDVSTGYFRDYNMTCHSSELAFHALLLANSVPQLASLTDAFARFVDESQVVYISGRRGQVEKTCFQDSSLMTSLPPGGVSEVSVTVRGTVLLPPEFLLSEVNPDNPGGREDAEFVELFHPGRRSASLDNYCLAFYNGKNSQAYEVVNFTGHRTNEMGYFLVGSQGMTPKPDITLPANTIQNGGDAVALYHSTPRNCRKGMSVTDEGLVDALVYWSKASDKAEKLLRVLTPGQDILYEDDSVVTEDESLSRCNNLRPRDHSSYQVTRITPLADNACLLRSTVRPSLSYGASWLLINELGLTDDTSTYEFIELKGAPGSSMDAFTLVLFSGEDGKAYNSISLQGNLREDGFFVIGLDRVLRTDQLLPPHFAPAAGYSASAVALYRGSMTDFPVGLSAMRKNLEDAVVYAWESDADPELLSVFGTAHYISKKKSRSLSLSRCSCCNSNATLQFAVSDLTPGTENSCPVKAFSVDLDICLKILNCSRWNEVPDKVLIQMRTALSRSIDDNCSCGFSQFYLKELHLTCTHTKMEITGRAWARSLEHQHLIQGWYAGFLSSHHLFLVDGSSLEIDPECATPIGTQAESKGSFHAWQLSLIILASVLVGVAVAATFLYYLKRRPQSYTTIEMNDQREIISDY
ncbi:uncharacterized protein LOC115075968 [Rhinatrema bivittatum]|uniref:uncharacterized protein LOC115075968 n=1 Tax=Rhinatrema bivittatum TaxID=194408 RepID=UPI00112D638E|nr:uncharacterized protein LOC115075968 [Rhinatrema bivittatum]